MMRTATRDTELGGARVRAGDRLLLFYASANRDDAVFDAPYAFRIDRRPNPHLGFGIGEHFCLGAHLARRSQRALFAELVGRLAEVEEDGTSLLERTTLVYGSGIGDGNRHDHGDLPIAVVGGGTRGGRHVVAPKDTPLANLHLALLARLGADVPRFADSTGAFELA